MPHTMLTIRIRADMRFKVCSTLLNHSLPARDALTRVFQGMPVCQVMYKLCVYYNSQSVPLVKLFAYITLLVCLLGRSASQAWLGNDPLAKKPAREDAAPAQNKAPWVEPGVIQV